MLLLAACSETRTIERCPEGQIATVSGCLPVPAAAFDASGRADAAPADEDAGIAPLADAAPADALSDSGVDPDPMDAARPDTGVVGFSLDGVWALEITDVQRVASEALGARDEVTITTLARVEVLERGTSLGLVTQVCSIVSTPFAGYTTTHPPAAIASLGLDQGSATLSEQREGASIELARRVEVMGWHAAVDPVFEQVPEVDNDPRLVDGDQDQNPGVSLEITGPISGQMYVASRAVVTLNGTVLSRERIEGTSHTTRVRNTLGGSNDLLASADVTFTPSPDAAGSRFRMVRVPEMIQPSCEGIIDGQEQLFP
jgi:hypothetical protein